MKEFEYDSEHIQALGRAIYDFCVLEHAIIKIARLFSPNMELNTHPN